VVKVLKPGFNVDKVYRCTCTVCKCEFEFEKAEARYVSDFRDGDARVIPCPTCGKECWVSA